MKDRIRLIMESEQLTPSAFADKLQLGRAVISHILNGRNNPSLDVVARILSNMNNINPDWLITGNGSMYKAALTEKASTAHQPLTDNYSSNQNQPDLFSQNYVSPPIAQQESEYRKEIVVEQPQKVNENVLNQTVIYQKMPDRKISKIIIYYTDNTFETFDANNKPL